MSQAKTTKSPKIPTVKRENIQVAKKSLPIPEKEIEQLNARKTEKLIFSFRFFDRSIEAFNLAETKRVCDNWFVTLVEGLSDVCKLTRNELIEQRQHYDAHPHEWSNLKYRYPLDEKFVNQVECLQFRLSQSKGRVHGFIVGNIFYIVWLDPHHNLYPGERFGGEKIYDRPLSCFENVQLENISLLKEIDYSRREKEKAINDLNEFLNEHEKAMDEIAVLSQMLADHEDPKKIKAANMDKYNKKLKKRRK